MTLFLSWRLCGALLIALAPLGACSPPPELEGRAPSPATATAASLLPPGEVQSVAHARARDAAEVRTPWGARMAAWRFGSEAEARTEFAGEADATGAQPGVLSGARVDFGTLHYLRYTTAAATGLLWQSDHWVFAAEAFDRTALAAVIAQSRAGGTGASGLAALDGAAFVAALIGLAAAVVAVTSLAALPLMLRWLAVHPAPGTPSLSTAHMRERLLALNAADRPWQVRTGPEADLIVEWKYADAAWWGVLAKSGISKTYRLRLYLDETRHQCGALDEFAEVEWSAGALAAPWLNYRRSFLRGVQLMRRERGVAFGWRTPVGGAGKVLDYRFDIDELRQPVIAAVVAAGWTWQPVFWPGRRRHATPGA